MILKKIRLYPFAGVSDKEVCFKKGLNVINGPNEAGKSTIVKAILFALFTSTKLTPVQEKNTLADYLPLSGGDTIKISLEFEENGIEYKLEKSWGGTKSSVLQKAGDVLMSDPTIVQNQLGIILNINEATWRNMLFAHQAALDKTIDNIQNVEIINSFSGLLRGAVMAQGGVSADKLKMELEQIINKDYYGSWDRLFNTPANGRGINNKAINNKGKVLSFYYLLEEAKRDLVLCSAYELQIDRLAVSINALTGDVIGLDTFVKSNESLVKDVLERQKLVANLELLKMNLEAMKKDQLEWPMVQGKLVGSLERLQNLEKYISALRKELEIAEIKDGAKSKLEKYEYILGLQAELKTNEDELALLKKVETEDLLMVKTLVQRINDSIITLEAQKLKIALVAKTNFKANLSRGISDIEEKNFIGGERFELDVAGKFGFETELFSLDVFSGNADIHLLSEQISTSKTGLNEIFEKYGIENSNDLNLLADKEKVKKTACELKRDTIKRFNDKDDIMTLKKETEDVKILPSVREINILRTELEAKTNELTMLNTTQELDKKTVSAFIDKYATVEKLYDILLEKNTDIRGLENQIKNLKALPEDVSSPDAFVTEFEDKKKNLQSLKDELNVLILDKTTAEKEEPLKSSFELTEEIVMHQKEFDAAKLKGAAYEKILANLNEILDAEAENVFNPYLVKTSNYFSKLTGGKYTDIIMESIIPSGVTDGKIILQPSLLSQGTKDSLALALRLSMADYYLENSNGFIVMDDPLTEMDLSRQILAANCIRNFADDKQVILFTCHDAHCNILQGNAITLN